MSMVSAIQDSDLPIATIVDGKAMSCGSVLFSCGTEGLRYMSPNSTLMIHEVSTSSWGKIEEIKADVKEGERLNKLVFKIMAKNCGKSDDYFEKLIHKKNHADWYLTSSEAKKHNIANHIKIPTLKINVSVEMKLT